jgi:hypothetical protein
MHFVSIIAVGFLLLVGNLEAYAATRCWRMPDGQIQKSEIGRTFMRLQGALEVPCDAISSPKVLGSPPPVFRSPSQGTTAVPAPSARGGGEACGWFQRGMTSLPMGKPYSPETSACGNNKAIQLAARGVEIAAAYSGYSFNPACVEHDRCYGASSPTLTRKWCDDHFAAITSQICADLRSQGAKTRCERDQLKFYQAIRACGDRPFCDAQGRNGDPTCLRANAGEANASLPRVDVVGQRPPPQASGEKPYCDVSMNPRIQADWAFEGCSVAVDRGRASGDLGCTCQSPGTGRVYAGRIKGASPAVSPDARSPTPSDRGVVSGHPSSRGDGSAGGVSGGQRSGGVGLCDVSRQSRGHLNDALLRNCSFPLGLGRHPEDTSCTCDSPLTRNRYLGELVGSPASPSSAGSMALCDVSANTSGHPNDSALRNCTFTLPGGRHPGDASCTCTSPLTRNLYLGVIK